MKINAKDVTIRSFYQLKVGDCITNARYLATDNYKMHDYIVSKYGHKVPCSIVIAKPNGKECTSGRAIQVWIAGDWRIWTSPIKSIKKFDDELLVTTSHSIYRFGLC